MQNWSKIPGFSDYLVSDNGQIKSIDRLKTFKNGRKMKFESKQKQLRRHPSNGFLMTDLINDKGIRKTVYPHKVVAAVFLKNDKPRKKKVVIHLDHNLENNHVSNLKWCSFSESIRIGFATGKRDNSSLWEKRRAKYGPNGGNSSIGRPDPLNEAQKKEILQLRKSKSLKELSEIFSCSISHVHKTIKRLTEPHLRESL